ncbi:putative phytanoyl-CoA dioxygenase (PhyH) [Lyophyllum shimeji]|uniref:Phytanoyl-CoA dioxygenase (PhyH) n=1 Tax=Lyophyllum shimeji TaxID=47721 RepID=A0A9P3URK7_LYOSH|nr:putative phytanoyl-CoA dioxygenase (PhyH) [Lyophyllum shimeji]
MVSELRALYDKQGFVVVPGLISDEEQKELREACDRVIALTREGKWPHRRTVGKQFPPFGDDNPDSWGVQHVMHPDLGEPAFARWYTSQPLSDVVKQLLECGDEDLEMELFNLLINPLGHSFALRWHRDDVGEKASEEEEREALQKWHFGVQWNTALYRDSCLYVVPGSHRIPRTTEQRKHSETMEPPTDPLAMPGAVQLTLQPGETVFYNSNILHCATYSSAQRRATLHANMGNVKGGATRARNVLQHGLTWMKGDTFREGLTEKGKAMLDRLIAMQEKAGDVGYSLAG